MLNKIENYIQTLNLTDKLVNFEQIYQLTIDKFYSDKNASIYKINFIFYDKFNIDPSNFEPIQILCNKRVGQTKFREDVINFYNKCIISGDDPEQCQACHIIPFNETKFNHGSNGLLLNYNLHHLFDEFKIGFKFINLFDVNFDNYQVILSDKIKTKQSYNNYLIYDNTFVKINKLSKQYLTIRYEQFINNSI